MRLAAPPYLHLLWLIPALLAFYLSTFARQRQALALFMDLALAPRLLLGYSRTRQWCKALCLVGAVGCLALALVQPQWGRRWQDVPSQGRDIMILLDVSRSMLAEDMLPNRLERAKAAIGDLVQAVQKAGGHRLGLVAFAGRATLHCPLTLDYAFFLQRLNAVGPDSVTVGGTAIGEAIRLALQRLVPVAHPYKDIILLTDGEDHHSFPLEAAHTAAAQQVSLYTIGIGDPDGGAPIPLEKRGEHRTYLHYQGQEVRSHMQQSLLQELAHLTGGVYMPVGTPATTMARLYTAHIAPKARRHVDASAGESLVPRYHWFVLAALLLLATEMLVREKTPEDERHAETEGRQMERRRQVIWQRLLAVGLVLLPYLATPGHAASPYEAIQQGNALYQVGRYEAAAQQYATAAQAFPKAADIHFNQGNALYKQGNYAHALEHYLRALSTDNRILASRVKYNLGNVQYQQALEAMRASQDAATPLRAAMISYRESLQLEPHYQEARYNLELAHLLLRQLQLQAGQEQQTDQHQDLPLAQQTPLPGATLRAPQPETSQASQAQPDGQAQEHAALDNADSPAASTEKLPELRPEEAQRLLEAIRQRARQADEHRQQWRGASGMRMRVDTDW